MSARVEVVAVTDCPVCVPGWNWKDCEHCDGTGEVRRVVTCAGCRWWEATAADGSAGLCGNTVVVGVTTAATWGCGDWEATEATAREIAQQPAERVTRATLLRYHVLTCEDCKNPFEALVTRFPKKCSACRPRKYRRGV